MLIHIFVLFLFCLLKSIDMHFYWITLRFHSFDGFIVQDFTIERLREGSWNSLLALWTDEHAEEAARKFVALLWIFNIKFYGFIGEIGEISFLRILELSRRCWSRRIINKENYHLWFKIFLITFHSLMIVNTYKSYFFSSLKKIFIKLSYSYKLK